MCNGRAIYPMLEWEFLPLGDLVEPNNVDANDFAFLAGYWQETGLGPCGGGDLDGDGDTDTDDLKLFTNFWLWIEE